MFLLCSNPMPKPTILLTGQAAGTWYKNISGQLESPDAFHTVQVDFDPINALLPNRLQEAAMLLQPYFEVLERQKQPYILANITLHEAVQYFTFTPKYFISIGDILQQELSENLDKVVILGTQYTMNHSFIPSLISNQGVEQLPADLQDEVNELRKVYNHGGDPERSKKLFQKLEQFSDHKFMIACTELAMVLKDANPDPSLKIIHLPLLQCQSIISGSSVITR